jgi:hypothetical protein
MNYIRLFSIVVILINSFRLLFSNDPIESSIGLILIPVFVVYLKKVIYRLQQ